MNFYQVLRANQHSKPTLEATVKLIKPRLGQVHVDRRASW